MKWYSNYLKVRLLICHINVNRNFMFYGMRISSDKKTYWKGQGEEKSFLSSFILKSIHVKWLSVKNKVFVIKLKVFILSLFTLFVFNEVNINWKGHILIVENGDEESFVLYKEFFDEKTEGRCKRIKKIAISSQTIYIYFIVGLYFYLQYLCRWKLFYKLTRQ